MPAGEQSATETVAWSVDGDPVVARARAKEASRVQLYEAQANSVGFVIVSSLFLVFMAAALLVGGHAAIGPALQSAMSAREAKGVGDVVYTMPDGVFCRHVTFDNVTAEITESALERCPNDIGRTRNRAGRGFAWGPH